jgi:hypothetical protein
VFGIAAPSEGLKPFDYENSLENGLLAKTKFDEVLYRFLIIFHT